MRLSIIIAVYDSHEAVKRQVKYFRSLELPDDIEFILVDDGSDPPHDLDDYDLANLTVYWTHDTRPWTQGLARNFGVKQAKGEYLLMTDIDHILSYEAIMDSYKFTGDRMMFPRFFGVLLEDGTLTQDLEILEDYGYDMSRYEKRGLYASYHGNTLCIKKSTFEKLGCYNPKYCTYGYHATSRKGEDARFNGVWNKYAKKEGISPAVGSGIYMFPSGRYHKNNDFNPKGLFHELSYDPK